MENTTLIATISALVGSGTGVVINKLFDLWQTNKQHKLALKTEYFKRKLDTFENSVSLYTSIAEQISSLGLVFAPLLNENMHFDDETMDSVMESINTQYKNVSEKTLHLASSIRLYKDISTPELNTQLQQFYFTLGEIGKIVNDWNETDINDIKKENSIIRALKNKIKNLTELSLVINISISDYISTLRVELQKHN
ncbi:MAG: hypothetical protein ACK4EY_06060 [Flavipsychrobacter sp.]